MSFSPTDAAFEGFRLTRRLPRMLIALALVYLAFTAVLLLVAFRPVGELMTLMNSFSTGSEPSEAEMAAFLTLYGQIVGISLLPSLVVNAVVQAAISRAVISGGDDKYLFLRLGKDELRVMAVNLVVGLILVAIGLVGFGIVGALVGFAMTGYPLLLLLAVVLMLAVIALLTWMAVRMCLVVPIAVVEKRFGIARSFALTRRHFWPLVGMMLLAVVLSIAVSLLGSIVTTPLTMLTGGLGVLAGGNSLTGGVIAALFVWAVLSAVLSAAQLLIMYAPMNAAYKQITA